VDFFRKRESDFIVYNIKLEINIGKPYSNKKEYIIIVKKK